MKRGFTLLEVLVVLTILALVTAMAAVRLQEPYRIARREEALRRCEFIDSQARAHARTVGGDCEIVISLKQQRIHACRKTGDTARHFEFAIPAGLSLQRVLTPTEDLASGIARIDVSSCGATATYALGFGDAEGAEYWLLFAGVTGRVTYPKDALHAQTILEMLRTPGADLD